MTAARGSLEVVTEGSQGDRDQAAPRCPLQEQNLWGPRSSAGTAPTALPYHGVTGVSHCSPSHSVYNLCCGLSPRSSSPPSPPPTSTGLLTHTQLFVNTFKSIAEHTGSNVRFSVQINTQNCAAQRGLLGQRLHPGSGSHLQPLGLQAWGWPRGSPPPAPGST